MDQFIDIGPIVEHLKQHVAAPFWGWIDAAMVRKRGRQPRAHAWVPGYDEPDNMASLCNTASNHSRLALIAVGEKPVDLPDGVVLDPNTSKCSLCLTHQRQYLKLLEVPPDVLAQSARDWNTRSYKMIACAARKRARAWSEKAQAELQRVYDQQRAETAAPKTPAQSLDDDWIPKIDVKYVVSAGRMVVDRSIMRKEYVISLMELVALAHSQGLLPKIPDNAVIDLVSMGITKSDQMINTVGVRARWLEKQSDHVVAPVSGPACTGFVGGFEIDPSQPDKCQVCERPSAEHAAVQLPQVKLRARPDAVIAARASGRTPRCAGGCGMRLTPEMPPGAYCPLCTD